MVKEATVKHRLIPRRMFVLTRQEMIHVGANEAMSDPVNDLETKLHKDPTEDVMLMFCVENAKRKQGEVIQSSSDMKKQDMHTLYARLKWAENQAIVCTF